MAFFKFRTRGPQANEGRNTSVAAVPAESVEAMRRRARHRLVGAAVLVLAGVVGFPLLFDTQPRPVSVDIPIEIPDRNKAKPLVLPSTPPPAAPAATSPPTSSSPTTAAAAPSGSGMITESADGSDISQSRPAPNAPPAETRAAAPQPKPEAKPEAKPEPKPEARPVPPRPSAPDDGARARALLEGSKPGAAASVVAAKPAAAEETGRFVVQVGAFADADKARDVRQKLEKAGLKTFTTVAKTADGERTRVRVGPFATRADADRAASRIKGLSLSASVLSL